MRLAVNGRAAHATAHRKNTIFHLSIASNSMVLLRRNVPSARLRALSFTVLRPSIVFHAPRAFCMRRTRYGEGFMFAKLPERFPRKLSAGIRPTTNVFGHVGLQVKNRLVRVFQKNDEQRSPFNTCSRTKGLNDSSAFKYAWNVEVTFLTVFLLHLR